MKKFTPRPLSRYSKLILHIELPLSLLGALIFLISYLQERAIAPVSAAIRYAHMTVYLLFPLIIAAFSVLLIERLLMENSR